RMSLTPSPSKSPVAVIVQSAIGNEPRPIADLIVPLLFISHSAIPPAFSRQRMSRTLSLLRSPVPAICQLMGTLPTVTDDCNAPELFRNQIATLPLVSRQRMSPMPSPLKSPVPTMLQEMGSEPTLTTDMIVAPFISHNATTPLLWYQRISLEPSPFM